MLWVFVYFTHSSWECDVLVMHMPLVFDGGGWPDWFYGDGVSNTLIPTII